MNNQDNMLTFMDAWLCATRGEDFSRAIERQESRGQQEIVRNQRLPKKTNSIGIPNEIFFAGVTNEMDFSKRLEITDRNCINYTKIQYEKMGIKIIDEYDGLFWNVILPDGWEIKATEHSMWNELRDNKDRKRATFFYKAAFYDRSAFINFNTRFSLSASHTAPADSEYEIWKKSDLQGIIKDGDTIIYQTKAVPATADYAKDDEIERTLLSEIRKFMEEHYPEYEDINAYWEEVE